jgi:DNA-binding Xre family transcriptional regulator
MITNERQYRITKAALKKFEASIAAHDAGQPSPDVHPRIYQAMGDALRSEAEVLQTQLREYDRLRTGRVKQRTLRSLNELPKAIIEARIAARVTQKALADRLGIAEQQVQRWEATKYAGVSIERLQEVADALGAKVTEKVQFTVVRNNSAPARLAGTRAPVGKGSTAATGNRSVRRAGPAG